MKYLSPATKTIQHPVLCWIAAVSMVFVSASALLVYAIQHSGDAYQNRVANDIDRGERPSVPFVQAIPRHIEQPSSAIGASTDASPTLQPRHVEKVQTARPSLTELPQHRPAAAAAVTSADTDKPQRIVFTQPDERYAASLGDAATQQDAAAPTEPATFAPETTSDAASPKRERIVARGIATTRAAPQAPERQRLSNPDQTQAQLAPPRTAAQQATPANPATPTVTDAEPTDSPQSQATTPASDLDTAYDASDPSAPDLQPVPSEAELTESVYQPLPDQSPKPYPAGSTPDPETLAAPLPSTPTQTNAPRDETLDTPLATSLTRDGTDRLISWLNIGYTSRSAADFHIGRGLKQRGWRAVIRETIEPQIDWGVRRVMLHNPFGTRSRYGPMPFDQYLEAKAAGMDWIVDDFVDAWKPVVQGDYSSGERVEVIAYIGSITTDPSMQSLVDSGQLDEWHERAEASVAPLIDAGMSIGFDAGSRIQVDHPAYEFLLDLQRRGTKVYIETYPRLESPHLFKFPVIAMERFHRVVKNHQTKFPLKHELDHRIARLINGHARIQGDPNWQTNIVLRALADGDNVATNFMPLIEQGLTKQRLLEQATILQLGVFD